MTKPAALQGDYTDLRFIKSRKVCVISVEFPIEAGRQIVEAFGTPLPGTGVPVAIARLNTNAEKDAPEPRPAREHRRFDEMRPSAQAAMRCEEPEFQRFLGLTDGIAERCLVIDAESAAFAVRYHCKVVSRSEFDRDPKAEARWRELHGTYQASRLASEHERH